MQKFYLSRTNETEIVVLNHNLEEPYMGSNGKQYNCLPFYSVIAELTKVGYGNIFSSKNEENIKLFVSIAEANNLFSLEMSEEEKESVGYAFLLFMNDDLSFKFSIEEYPSNDGEIRIKGHITSAEVNDPTLKTILPNWNALPKRR